MAEVLPDDVLFRAGGATLLRYGVAGYRRGVRGWELGKETFTRADATTCATWEDRAGLVHTADANILRATWRDLDGDGILETPCLRQEGSRTNELTRSEDFSHGDWAKANVT